MDMRFPYSPAEVAKVRMVQFGILSPDEIVTSRCPITFHSFSVWFSGNYRKNKRKKKWNLMTVYSASTLETALIVSIRGSQTRN